MAETMQVNSLLNFAILFVIISVAITLGAEILEDIRETQDDDTSVQPNNESITWTSNNTAIALKNDRLVDGTEVLYNGSKKVNKGANYTINYTGGVIRLLNQTEWAFFNNSATLDLNLSYSKFIGSAQRNITDYGLSSQNTQAKWLPTVALVIIIAVVVGVLLTYLARRFD